MLLEYSGSLFRLNILVYFNYMLIQSCLTATFSLSNDPIESPSVLPLFISSVDSSKAHRPQRLVNYCTIIKPSKLSLLIPNPASWHQTQAESFSQVIIRLIRNPKYRAIFRMKQGCSPCPTQWCPEGCFSAFALLLDTSIYGTYCCCYLS